MSGSLTHCAVFWPVGFLPADWVPSGLNIASVVIGMLLAQTSVFSGAKLGALRAHAVKQAEIENLQSKVKHLERLLSMYRKK